MEIKTFQTKIQKNLFAVVVSDEETVVVIEKPPGDEAIEWTFPRALTTKELLRISSVFVKAATYTKK